MGVVAGNSLRGPLEEPAKKARSPYPRSSEAVAQSVAGSRRKRVGHTWHQGGEQPSSIACEGYGSPRVGVRLRSPWCPPRLVPGPMRPSHPADYALSQGWSRSTHSEVSLSTAKVRDTSGFRRVRSLLQG